MKPTLWFTLTGGLALVALGIVGGTASATPLVLDYTGFSWTTPGVSPNHIWGVGVVDGFSLPVNDPSQVYTYYLSNLDLSQVINYTNTKHTYVYSGGNLGVYRSTNASNIGYNYGINPMNPTSPSSFIDGTLWLGGAMTDFSLYFDDTLKLGTLSADGVFNSGEFAPQLAGPSYFTFSGVTARPGNGIPQGYKYRLDGQTTLDLGSPVPEPASLFLMAGGLMGLAFAYRRRNAR